MKQSINHQYQLQQFQYVSTTQLPKVQKEKQKHQPKLDLLKSLLKDQSSCQISQKSQISTNDKKYIRIQKIQVEPELKVDELKEHQWQILSQNCQYLLELSRQILDKPNYELLYRSTSNPRLIEHDQPLKPNVNCNSKQSINNQKNCIQAKFALIQHSKRRSSNKSFNNNNHINVAIADKPFLKKHSSLHVSPTHQSVTTSQTSQSSTKFFFAKLNQVSSNAYNLQRRLKQEQFDEIKQTNEKVLCIRSDFDKFSKMLDESEKN
ncbi:unnamed protein product (macronuclear) [Paramecium tetraurelia]|uniref:Uncharacterized protein n=1 Tax=Paramecium tetraurelia TaxID=5888 RepID=A0BQY8_PARTE|nr:uncharacterized protein GSPATT00031184001 [Paramecium tetraurelia]CAK60955.1 unnamed protein product [Paramecium tetraurelia]|eukprot:XP_001428353.1 hypothetical protein (macronuclear) [Paramecium tetraurelia strain d4-2]